MLFSQNIPYYIGPVGSGSKTGWAEIKEKGQILPWNIEKKIDIGSDGTENLVEKNSVNLGDTILFKTTINVKPGAEKYVLHDKMNSNLEKLSILHIYDNKNDSYKSSWYRWII